MNSAPATRRSAVACGWTSRWPFLSSCCPAWSVCRVTCTFTVTQAEICRLRLCNRLGAPSISTGGTLRRSRSPRRCCRTSAVTCCSTLGQREFSYDAGAVDAVELPALVTIGSIDGTLTFPDLDLPSLARIDGGLSVGWVFGSNVYISAPALTAVMQKLHVQEMERDLFLDVPMLASLGASTSTTPAMAPWISTACSRSRALYR